MAGVTKNDIFRHLPTIVLDWNQTITLVLVSCRLKVAEGEMKRLD